MKIIFLGAGQGSRLHPYTKNRPKWLLEIRGIPLLEYLVSSAHKCGATEIVVVRGCLGGNIKCPSIVYIDDTDGNNMVHSLFKAHEFLNGDVIISYADILYEPKVLYQLQESRADISVVVDLSWYKYYSTRVKEPLSIAESLVISNNKIVEIGQQLRPGELPMGQYIGLIKLSGEGARIFKNTYHDVQRQYRGKPWRNAKSFEKAYMTDFIQEVADRGVEVRAVPIQSGWMEFDTRDDYERMLELDQKGQLSEFIEIDHLPLHPSVLSSGGVVLRRSSHEWEVLLVGNEKSNQWYLPKGMQEPGETIEMTAVREVREETAISPEIVNYVGHADWSYSYEGIIWDERAHYFLMRAICEYSGKLDGEHQTVAWLPFDQAELCLQYDAERAILCKCISLPELENKKFFGKD